MDWKIVTDTGSNIRQINDLPESISFDIIPLILHIDNEDFVDTPDLDIELLNQKVAQSSESSSACPAPGVYAEKFKGADHVICFTISSELSGSYNSAEQGKQIALEENPDADIYIFDSKSAGGENDLLVFKAIELVKEGFYLNNQGWVTYCQSNEKFAFQLSALPEENTYALMQAYENECKSNGRSR